MLADPSGTASPATTLLLVIKWAILICVVARHGFIAGLIERKDFVPGTYLPIRNVTYLASYWTGCLIPAWGYAGRMHGCRVRAFYIRLAPHLFCLKLSTDMLSFQDTRLALLHIPLHLYHNFLQSILQLLLPIASGNSTIDDSDGAVQPPDGWADEQPFINISVTPVECSVVCSRKLVDDIFNPVLKLLDITSRNEVHITTEDFVVMQVDGEGLDADRRVLELTGPLALAGM